MYLLGWKTHAKLGDDSDQALEAPSLGKRPGPLKLVCEERKHKIQSGVGRAEVPLCGCSGFLYRLVDTDPSPSPWPAIISGLTQDPQHTA